MYKEENEGKGCLQAMTCFYICLTNLSFRLEIQEQRFQAPGVGRHHFRRCVGPLPQLFLLQRLEEYLPQHYLSFKITIKRLNRLVYVSIGLKNVLMLAQTVP